MTIKTGPPPFMTRAGFRQRLVVREDWRNARYNDPDGNPTIGVGHLLHPDDETQYWTDAQVEHHLRRDTELAVRGACSVLNTYGQTARAQWVQQSWDDGKVEPRAFALIDLAFNMGPVRLRGFSGMFRAIGRGDWIRAGDELLFINPDATVRKQTPYAAKTGIRAADNAYMLRTGQFPMWPERQPHRAGERP